LWDQNLVSPEQRLEYGMLLLRKSRKDLAARAADPALRVLGGIARAEGAKLAAALGKDRSVGAEELYYLGFHWAEGAEDVQGTARLLLGLVTTKYPRHKLRRAAEHKLELLERRNTAETRSAPAPDLVPAAPRAGAPSGAPTPRRRSRAEAAQ